MHINFKPKLEVVFYRSILGNEPVRDWLKSMVKEDKRTLGENIKTVQFSWPLGMPLVRYLGNGLWEIRSALPSKRIARIIFFTYQHIMILLHGFIKKSTKTPHHDIALANHRKKEIIRDLEL